MFYPTDSILISNLDEKVKAQDIKDVVRDHCPGIISVELVYKHRQTHAFVKFKNVKDILGILQTLHTRHLQLNERKLKFSRIGLNEVQNFNLDNMSSKLPSKELFNLSAADPNLPCIHILNDDVLLEIFKYLSVKELSKYEKVCRRFKFLIDLAFSKKLSNYNDGCISQWIADNLKVTPLKCLNLLKNCGHTLKKVEIDCCISYFMYKVGLYFPNLEELTVINHNSHLLNCFGKTSKQLKKLSLFTETDELLNGSIFKSIFENFPQMEKLEVHNEICVDDTFFIRVPKSLKEFSSFGGLQYYKSPWSIFFERCRNLETFRLSSQIPTEVIEKAAQLCPNMKEMFVDFHMVEDIFNWSIFHKLEKLKVRAMNTDLYKLSLCKSLVELNISKVYYHSKTKAYETTDLIGDFSTLTHLRSLTLYVCPQKYISLLATIPCCQELEFLEVNIDKYTLKPIILCIESLPKLGELVCKELEVTKSVTKSLCKVKRKREATLKLTIMMMGEDNNDLVGKLRKFNYDVDEYNSFEHNLSCESEDDDYTQDYIPLTDSEGDAISDIQ